MMVMMDDVTKPYRPCPLCILRFLTFAFGFFSLKAFLGLFGRRRRRRKMTQKAGIPVCRMKLRPILIERYILHTGH
jgi:hypothetical protein